MTPSNLYVNASDEPMFINVPEVFGDDADFRLAAGSKAIGFGVFKDYMPETDVTGADRSPSSIDCGAYVYNTSSSVAPPSMLLQTHHGDAYNLQGQKIGKNYHGLVIINEKKYMNGVR